MEPSSTIVLDTVAPVTTDNSDGARHRRFTLVLTPTDAAGSVESTQSCTAKLR